MVFTADGKSKTATRWRGRRLKLTKFTIMAFNTTFLNNLLLLYFENTDHALVGDATGVRGSTTAGSLFISIHTGDPVAGNQTTSEATYTSYARVAVGRAGANWTTAAAATENTAAITFPAATGGSDTITHFAIGTATSGAGSVIATGTCSLSVSSGITPEFAAGALDVSVS